MHEATLGSIKCLAESLGDRYHVRHSTDHVEALIRILPRLLTAVAVDTTLLARLVRSLVDRRDSFDQLGSALGSDDRMANVVSQIEGSNEEDVDARHSRVRHALRRRR